jgi:beta-RFAP synthase
MSQSVRIQTGARLHFGPLTNGLQRGRLFGGIGMMIDEPVLEVMVRKSEENRLHLPEALRGKVRRIRDRYRESFGADASEPIDIAVTSETGLHAGLGTGTQLAMAVAAGIDRLHERQHTFSELARAVGRGQRSALGVHGFQRGGFLVDGGKRDAGKLGTLSARQAVPADWKIVLITPTDTQGLSGSAEIEAFETLDAMPEATTNQLCRLVLMDLLPALQEHDFAGFSTALYAYGALVGDYFAAIQGGRYADPRMCRLVDWLREAGAAGVGQSSWGPTIFAFCENEDRAKHLQAQIRRKTLWNDCRFLTASPLNAGASVKVDSESIVESHLHGS